MSLITTILNPPKEGEAVRKKKELIKQKMRKKRKGKGRKLSESGERGRPFESVYHHYFTMIGELFFLKQKYVFINQSVW